MVLGLEGAYISDLVIKRFTRKCPKHEIFGVLSFAVTWCIPRERASEDKLQLDEIRKFSWARKRPRPARTPCTGCAPHPMHKHARALREIVVHYFRQDRAIDSSCSYVRYNEYVRAATSEEITLLAARCLIE